MPRRNRPRGSRGGGRPPPIRPPSGVAPAWADHEGWVVRGSQKGGSPCPDCNRPIVEGKQHVVAWPEGREDDRRHWHTECWRRELRRGGPTP